LLNNEAFYNLPTFLPNNVAELVIFLLRYSADNKSLLSSGPINIGPLD
jgi:hypothetical protein